LLARSADEQLGVVSLDQVTDAGIGPRAAQHRAVAGRMHRLHRGVYALGHRSIGRHGELLAATIACGEGSVISHGSAAALWGLRDRWPHLIDVTVTCEAGRKLDGIRPRRCRYPTPEEVTVHELVPCTTPARTIVDLAGMVGLDPLRRLVERAAVLKLLDMPSLDAALSQASGRRGIPALRAVLEDWRTDDGKTPDVRSLFEARLLPLIVATGLPRPRCNEVKLLEGRRFKLDFLWEEQRLVVETDGEGSHRTPVAFQRDRLRDQILIAAGYRVPRVTWHHVVRETDATVERICRMLEGSG
jgi:hypothetical protein